MTTHYAVREGGLGLASTAAGTIADPQVRNRGTIGGSLAHGDPASDMPAILLAAEGSVTVRGASGQREVAAADLFQDYLTTAVGDGEILTEVRLPALDGYGFGYEKFNRRAGGLGDGGRLRAGQEGAATARARTCGSGSRTWARRRCGRPPPSRRCAAGRSTRDAIAAAAEQAAEGTEPPADLNASADYKRHLARVLCRRALEQASP